jgi:hypothetical protein
VDKSTFEHEIAKAQTMQAVESDRTEYWIGYQRGQEYRDSLKGNARMHDGTDSEAARRRRETILTARWVQRKA